MTNKYELINDDCLEALKKMPDCFYDGVLSDPPYALTSGKGGKGGGFMGKDWDKALPPVEVWREVLRVCKPGAYILIFGGTRTFHRLTCNIEDSGFEIKDCLNWLYGQGFPKGQNISKALDRKLGAERTMVASKPRGKLYGDRPWLNDPNHKVQSDQPITEQAEQWAGYNTALKPAWEPIIMAQKPIERTYAENVIKWGCGGLNIDQCRIKGESITTTNGKQNEIYGDLSGNGGTSWSSNAKGRYPANLLLAHHPDCEYIGERTIKEGKADGERNTDESKTNVYGWEKGGIHKSGIHYGEETIEQWACNPDCPIKQLDKQSGKRSKGHFPKTQNTQSMFMASQGKQLAPDQYTDEGNTSRFFYCSKASKSERRLNNCKRITLLQVWNENNLIQEEQLATLLADMGTLPPKVIEESGILNKNASAWNTLLFGRQFMEKYQGAFNSTIGMETNSITTLEILNYFQLLFTNEYMADVNSLMGNGGSPVVNAGSCNQLIVTIKDQMKALALGVNNVVLPMQLKINVEDAYSTHPTVKPLALNRYLATLIKPPTGGNLLIPYSGSGSEMIAALQSGWQHVTGIEREKEYIEIAIARLKEK